MNKQSLHRQLREIRKLENVSESIPQIVLHIIPIVKDKQYDSKYSRLTKNPSAIVEIPVYNFSAIIKSTSRTIKILNI